MPVELKHPGVYIEELPSGVRPIIGVSTSTTAFVGRALKGPALTGQPPAPGTPPPAPTSVFSFPEFARVYGGLWAPSPMSFAVAQFFQNGGGEAIILRVAPGAGPASANVPAPGGALTLTAASPGAWGRSLSIAIETFADPAGDTFSIQVSDDDAGVVETWAGLDVDPNSPRYVQTVLRERSRFIAATVVPGQIPQPTANPIRLAGGGDGTALTNNDLWSAAVETALDRADFNLLCLPPPNPTVNTSDATFDAAAAYCRSRRSFLIVDPPSNTADVAGATVFADLLDATSYAALFVPRVRMPNDLKAGAVESFAPCGAVAGAFARTDAERGVWKAPAGLDAGLRGANGTIAPFTEGDIGQLNPRGINSIRFIPGAGTVLWGARTLEGADQRASQWKYIPVRRTALFIEESLYRGTQWVVFEPNDEPLWSQIRLNVGAFMNRLFRQGAFQGTTPAQAYFVKCDKETTTQDDIDRGVLNIHVGFAPLKPAEFVVIRIQQISSQAPA